MNLNQEQAIEILEKFDMFQGQRAGRELWNDKPFEVQEQDISNFSRDVALLIGYIKELTEKSDLWVAISKNYQRELDELVDANKEIQDELMVSTGEIERLTEENERLKAALSADISVVRVSRGSRKTNHLREVCRIRMDAVRADTVREMVDRIKAGTWHTSALGDMVYLSDIERIAKEVQGENL